MAGGNVSPRQKMINMMYLVLTALLALNVSAEILNAFVIVNDGIQESNNVIEKSTAKRFGDFQKLAATPEGADAKPYFVRAQKARTLCTALYDEIEKYKKEIIDKSGGYLPENPTELKDKGNIDVGTRIMVEEKEGDKLQKDINGTRDKLLALVTRAEDKKQFEASITIKAEEPKKKETQGGEKEDWKTATFHHVPVVGAVTILSKFQNDIKATEAKLLDYFINQVTAEQFHFDKLSAKVIAPKSYLTAGKDYTADIFLAAGSSQIHPDVYIGSLNWSKFNKDSIAEGLPDAEVPFSGSPRKIDTDANGYGKFSEQASGSGEKKYEGAIKLKNPKGAGFNWYAFKGDYEVAQAGNASVAATKMNVLYIGVPNPISVSASGKDITASITGGSLAKDKDGYIATVNAPGEVTISVNGKTMDGESKKFGEQKFRVKRIPDPKATLGGNVNLANKIQKGTLIGQGGLVPILEGFDFDCKFQVTEYTLIFAPSGQDIVNKVVQGPVIGPDIKGVLQRVKPKDVVIFDNIKARGCDGTTRKLGSLTFTII